MDNTACGSCVQTDCEMCCMQSGIRPPTSIIVHKYHETIRKNTIDLFVYNISPLF